MIYSILKSLENFNLVFEDSYYALGGDTFFLTALLISAIIEIACFTLKGVGLYAIAKREGISKPYFAFIPFLSYYLLGKIVGKVKVFGHHVKNLGLITMIALIINTVLNGVYDWLLYGENLIQLFKTGDMGVLVETYGSFWVDIVIIAISSIAGLIFIIAEVFLIMTFFMYYERKQQLLFSLLAILIEPLFGILVFAVRKNQRFDYSQYMKMRFDSYNANRTGGGFNNPQSPFTREGKSPFEDYESKNPYDTYEKENKKSPDDVDVFEDYSDKK